MFIIWLPVWGTGNKCRTRDLTIIWEGAKKRESFYSLMKTISTSQRLSKKVKSNAPSNLEMFIQQALIPTLTSNMSQTKLMHNVFIVEKWAFFFFWILFGRNKGQHLNQFNGPCIQHKGVLSYNLIRVVNFIYRFYCRSQIQEAREKIKLNDSKLFFLDKNCITCSSHYGKRMC